MKGVIVLPTVYKGAALRAIAMYSKLCKKYKFSLMYSDAPNLDAYDIAIIMCVPYHNRPGIPPGLLDAKCKLIGHFGDLQCWGNKECSKNKKILFDRYNLLIGTYYEKFREWYPQYVHKYVHWPQYFGPYERYVNLSINPKPKMRCLMIGSMGGRAYPLRAYVAKTSKSLPDNGRLDVNSGKRMHVPFEKYPKFINRYFCALALSGVYNFPETKYFEIPAAGALLLAKEVKELTICGLKPNVHYIPVTKKNVFGQIKKVLDNPQDYIEIRNRTTKFVRENYSDINKVDSFQEIFDRLEPGIHKDLLR